MDVSPDRLEFAVSVEDLDAVVLPVTYENRSTIIHKQAMGQVEMAGLGFPGLPPGRLQLAIPAEAVDPGVSVTIRDIEVSGWGWD